MKWNIEPYIWIKNSDKTIIQTRKNTVFITSEALANFLIKIEQEGLICLDTDIIEKSIENPDQAVTFLLENGIITKNITPIINEKKEIRYISNDKFFCKHLKLMQTDNFIEMDEIKNLSIDELSQFDGLTIFFLNPFSQELLERLTEKIKLSNITAQCIFTYNNKVYFSNIYKKDWYNPCPLCFFSELEAQLRNGAGDNNMSFQTLLDIFYEKEGCFTSKLPLNSQDYYMIIANIIKRTCSSRINVNVVFELDLNDYSTKEDVAYHWGYCDCYE